jgi:hypothetical protein
VGLWSCLAAARSGKTTVLVAALTRSTTLPVLAAEAGFEEDM